MTDWVKDLCVSQEVQEHVYEIEDRKYVFQYRKMGFKPILKIKSEHTAYAPTGNFVFDDSKFYAEIFKACVIKVVFNGQEFHKERYDEFLDKVSSEILQPLMDKLLIGTGISEGLKKN